MLCSPLAILSFLVLFSPNIVEEIGSGQPAVGEISPGSGFAGQTSAPYAIGDPGSPGYAAKAIARWTEFPFITRDRDFYITISAYHMSDIDRVEFILDGGVPVVTSQVQNHPETGYPEYMVKVDVSDLSPGSHEIRAIIYPNHGRPRILQGTHNTSNIHMLNNGNHSFWFNYDPAPTTVRVGPNAQFTTIDGALQSLGSDLIDGRIELEAGDYYWFTDKHLELNNTDDDKVLTICAAPGVSRSDIRLRRDMVNTRGPRSLSVHLKGLTILPQINDSENQHARLLSGSGNHDNRLFLEDVFCTADDGVPNGWGASGIQEIARPLVSWLGGLWVKHVDFENLPKGIDTVYLAKHTTFNRASWDLWGASPGSVLDCTIDKHDNFNAEHNNHADIIQFFVEGNYVENRIFADITATNQYSQIGHLAWSTKLRNFAFIRWTVDEAYGQQSLNFYPDFDHLVMIDCIFRNATVDFFNRNKRVLLRNMISWKYKGFDFNDAFQYSTTVIENVHFTKDSPMSWATHGPLEWSAPSAPVGQTSDGSDGFIPSLVGSPQEITHWSLGNRGGQNSQNAESHFYYDASLLDLSHTGPKPDFNPADLNEDGLVNQEDLALLLGAMGGSTYDITGDGYVDGSDLTVLLGSWS